MKSAVLLLPVLLVLGDTILDHTTILCNGATGNIAVYIPPEQELEFTELAAQHKKNLHTEEHVNSENCSPPHTTPSHVPLEEDKEIHVKKSFHLWSANGSSAISDGLKGSNLPKQRDVKPLLGEDEDQVECGSCLLGLFRKTKIHDASESQEPPESYDARIAYPHCKSISFIINQSNCRSCWAIAVAAAFSDRLCIQSGGKVNHNMSAGQLLSCFKENKGCSGGSPQNAWKYVEKQGLVTGGDYGSNEGCQPYPIAPVKGKSDIPLATTPECSKKRCPISYKAKDIRILPYRDEYEIRREIYNHGPVVTGMDSYPSFKAYKTGIYRKSDSSETKTGEHAVRIIGWGEEDGQKYWIVANSYGKEWGEDGFFKIPRGVNYCRIESVASCATPVFKQSIFG